MNRLNQLLHTITMYRLVSFSLLGLAILAVIFSLTGQLTFPTLDLLTSLLVLLVVAAISNTILAKIFKAAYNLESWLITATILFFILPPTSDPQQLAWTAIAAMLAMASKYLVTIHRHPILNPAAFAVLAIGLMGPLHASWWVATPILFIPTAIVGLLIVHKLHRWQVSGLYITISSLLATFLSIQDGLVFSHALLQSLTSWPIIFIATVMLTEPTTLPMTQPRQLAYAAMVAILMTSRWHIGPFFNTPEIALVVANILFFTIQPKQQVNLIFKEKIQHASDMVEFIFVPSHQLKFQAGQYVNLTIPSLVADSRGANRRTFTIASSPQDKEVRFAMRLPQPSSSFKRYLSQLQPGQSISASTVAGQFVLPKQQLPVVFIAGGIGITPYISIIRHLLSTDPQRLSMIHLIYQVKSQHDVGYWDVIKQAKLQGMALTMLFSDQQQRLTTNTVSGLQPPSLWYLSGPPAMVDNYKKTLHQSGINPSRLKTDYFSGY